MFGLLILMPLEVLASEERERHETEPGTTFTAPVFSAAENATAVSSSALQRYHWLLSSSGNATVVGAVPPAPCNLCVAALASAASHAGAPGLDGVNEEASPVLQLHESSSSFTAETSASRFRHRNRDSFSS